jgi:hypothetical protein
MQISLLRFFKKIHKFALCEFMPYALSYFILLVRFFGYFCPIWLMRILANANYLSLNSAPIWCGSCWKNLKCYLVITRQYQFSLKSLLCTENSQTGNFLSRRIYWKTIPKNTKTGLLDNENIVKSCPLLLSLFGNNAKGQLISECLCHF